MGGNRAVELACQLSRRSTEGLVEEASAHDRIRQKVKAVGRIARIFKTLRQERETVIRLKGVCPGHRLAPGLLLAGKDRMRSELEVFVEEVPSHGLCGTPRLPGFSAHAGG